MITATIIITAISVSLFLFLMFAPDKWLNIKEEKEK